MVERDEGKKIDMEGGCLFVRYAKESNKIRKKGVQRKLFQPTKDGRLSVQNIDGLEYSKIVEIGECVAKKDNKRLYGWAKLAKSAFEDAKLEVCIDNDPCPGHATISGWPEERNLRLDKQQFLAAASCGHLL